MFQTKKIKHLKKELNLFDVFAISTGTTLSGGFFLLPGLAAVDAGPALVLSYMLAAIPLVPAMFSIAELATAMPRAGGVYFFLDRTLGPLMGTIGGLGTWLALILKVAFALIGMGAYLALFFTEIPIIPIAVSIAILLGILNLFSVKGTGKFQVVLVVILLAVLFVFIGEGVTKIDTSNFRGFFNPGFAKIFSTTGLVYISYIGITKVASLSEEIKNPERNLPLGIFLSIGVTFLIYTLGTSIMVGIVPMSILKGDLTPVASAAKGMFGGAGVVVLTVAALVAFISVSNAGTMSASRYPFAMSRDYLMPHFFQRLSKKGIPFISIITTVSVIVLILIFLDPTKIAKLASSFQLLMFALVCLGVIVMRESKLASYDPGFHSPFYPWMQIVGLISPLFLIFEMGILSIGFSVGLILAGTTWFSFYAKDKVKRSGAIYHVFERLGRSRYHGLDTELRGILKEKGLREEDPYDEIVTRSLVLDMEEAAEFESVAEKASIWLSNLVPFSPEEIKAQFMEGTRIGMTPVTHGIALPHLRIQGLDQPEMVLVRSKEGVHITVNGPLTNHLDEEHIVHALFFLVSPEDTPTQHLRILAQIAGRVDDDSFADEWKVARNELELKESLLHDDRSLSLIVDETKKTNNMIGKALKEIKFPEGCLVALLHRSGQTLIPKGNFVFEEGDRLTIIGDPKGLKEIINQFGEYGN
jgi:amino acid transporter/mannitol/fructose-specific phosphotransferase system IIA component (Ntr-type)